MGEDFLNARRIQAWLGISKPTLLAWLRREQDPLPGVKIMGRWMFRRQAVLEWWKRQERARGARVGETGQRAGLAPKAEDLRSWLLMASKVLAEQAEKESKKQKG